MGTEPGRSIRDNYDALASEIDEFCRKSGRDPGEVKIVAVSKTFSVETIQDAIDQGITLLGENKVQEASGKIPGLTGSFSFHMVGHLQSNKARDAVKLFDCIHSIDKFSTAIKVDAEAAKIDKIQKILVQVNISHEESKSGTGEEETLNLIKNITELEHIELLGLMTMAPFTDEEEPIRRSFRVLRELMEKINRTLSLDLKELSMGMSSDYRIAVEEGSTMVRIGTAIFGQRDYP